MFCGMIVGALSSLVIIMLRKSWFLSLKIDFVETNSADSDLMPHYISVCRVCKILLRGFRSAESL